MKRASFVVAVMFLSLLGYGAQAQTQEAGMKGEAASIKRERQNKTAPQASQRGLSGKEKALTAKRLLEEAKEDLVYNCCIEDACDRCALDHQSCQCKKDLRAGKGICSDCYAGWQMGHGKIEGIKAGDVKPNFHSHNH